MFAVVEIAGKQYRVAPNDTITVPTLEGEPGSKVQFKRVLLLSGENGTQVGAPLVAGATVEGTILDHGKADKVIVFKKKKRKGYRLKKGHRQPYTQVQITNIAL
jgi:large subunit ribosomal protein L21